MNSANLTPDALFRIPPGYAAEERRVFALVAATIVTAAEVAIFVVGMRHVAPPSAPRAVSVRLIAMPAPTPPLPAEPALPAGPAPTVETVQAPPLPDTTPMIETAAPTPKPSTPIVVDARPMPAVPAEKPPPSPLRRVTAQRPRRSDTMMEAPAHSAISAPPSASAVSPPGGGTMGARAIYQPLPEIPEELRRHPTNLIAVARFRVAADGGATVELIRPTPDPRLNAALLVALKAWRFFPAMENGRPVASTVAIRIPIRVE